MPSVKLTSFLTYGRQTPDAVAVHDGLQISERQPVGTAATSLPRSFQYFYRRVNNITTRPDSPT